jgi:hypothetical protein
LFLSRSNAHLERDDTLMQRDMSLRPGACATARSNPAASKARCRERA